MNPLTAKCRPALARGVRLRIDPVTGGPVLLFPEGVLPLDETTHDIVSRCNGEATFDDIINSLADDYDADRESLLNDVRDCLEQLRGEMLITVAS